MNEYGSRVSRGSRAAPMSMNRRSAPSWYGAASRCVESTLSGEKRQIKSAEIAIQTNITMMKRPMVPSM